MSSNPIRAWMKWWPDRFESSTRDMSAAEVGVYLRLLNHAWKAGGLTDDHARLARICGCTEEEFLPLWRTVQAKWTPPETGDGLWTQEFQEEVRAEALKRSEHGRKAAEGRWGSNARASLEHMPNGKPDACPSDGGQGQGQEQEQRQSPDRATIPQQQHHGTQESPARFLALALCKSGLPLTELDGAEQILAGDRWLGGHGRLACTNRLQQIIAASQGASDQGACIVSLLEHDSAAHTGPIHVGGK